MFSMVPTKTICDQAYPEWCKWCIIFLWQKQIFSVFTQMTKSIHCRIVCHRYIIAYMATILFSHKPKFIFLQFMSCSNGTRFFSVCTHTHIHTPNSLSAIIQCTIEPTESHHMDSFGAYFSSWHCFSSFFSLSSFASMIN